MGNRISIVHGDASIRSCARGALEAAGYRIDEMNALRLTTGEPRDVVLVEWQLLDPFDETLAHIRSCEPTRLCRVIVLALRRDLPAAIASLEYGADECIGVPFEADELVVRIGATLRRAPTAISRERFQAGPFTLDKASHRVLVNDQPVELSPTEFRLLAFLLEHPGRVFNRTELLRRAWSKSTAGPRTVDVHVRRLRRQLEPFGCSCLIQTVRGFGYRLWVEEHGCRVGACADSLATGLTV